MLALDAYVMADEQLTLERVLEWDPETSGDLPPEAHELLAPDKIREHLTAAREQAAQAERERLAGEQEQARQRDEQQRQQQATMQADIDWAADIDKRLASGDEEARNAALAEKQRDEERYTRGLASKYQRQSAEVQNRVLAQHYAPLVAALTEEHPKFVENLSQRTGAAKGNPLLAAIDYGKTLTAESEYQRGLEEGKRAERIALGREGSADMGDSGKAGEGGTTRFADRRWVEAQKAADPRWGQKPSGQKDAYGRDISNAALALREMQRARA